MVLVACIVYLFFRVRQLRWRIENLERAASDTTPTPANAVESHLRDLTRRVYALEHAQPDRAPAPPPPPPLAQPVRIVPPPPRPPAPEPEPPPPPVYVPPEPSWRERLAERLQGQEWETLIGGSWLNKLGVLITVIGLALFLRYSLSNFGPAGRIALGTSLSLVMLATGVLLERRPRYLVYARGLLGGGWAALYFTAYAAHSLEAARVIDSPFTGALLLAAVACGMIGHSLRYRSQVVTGMAYILGFLALAITPLTTFSVVALIPLAASLAFVAHRFRWPAIAAFGVVATYGGICSAWLIPPAAASPSARPCCSPTGFSSRRSTSRMPPRAACAADSPTPSSRSTRWASSPFPPPVVRLQPANHPSALRHLRRRLSGQRAGPRAPPSALQFRRR